jgi:two-component system, OmpR family, phosphate regulon response regulator PhoB
MAHVLIVDDEADLASLLEFNLKQAGFRTSIALTGAQALSLARIHKPDICLLDVMLPDLSGAEVCRQLRQDVVTASIAIVMLTARTAEVDRVDGFEAGADDYVVKPFSPRELVLRLRALVRRLKKNSEEERIVIGALSLDSQTHRVSVDGETLPLTALEFRLLHQLMRNAGRVQSREQLLAAAWGITSQQETRTVDTHVMRLRDKLGTARHLLQTVRGVGYRFAERPAVL